MSERIIDARQLQLFHAVAQQRSMARAASALGYTPPAISHAMRRLERDVGVALLCRSGRGIALTEAGERLAAHAEVILTVMRSARDELGRLAAARAGRVRLAAFPSAAATIAPALLALIADTHPDITVEIMHAEPDEALPLVRRGEADIALSFDYPGVGEEVGLARQPLFVDELRAVVPAALVAGEIDPGRGVDPGAAGEIDSGAAGEIALGALRDQPWIAGCARCRSHLIDACERVGFQPAIVHATDDYVAVQGMVAAGLGVSLLPTLALKAFRRADVQVLRLRPAASRHVVACTLDARPPPPAVGAITDALRTVCARAPWSTVIAPDVGCT